MSPERNGTRESARTATVNLPFVTAQFRAPTLPHVPTPGRAEVTAALRTARTYLPSTKQLVYFGGLALAAAFEVVEWPVAAAIGIGTAIAGREEGGRQPEEEPRAAARTGAGRKRAVSTTRRAGSR